MVDSKLADVRLAWELAAEHQDYERLAGGLEGLCLYFDLRCRFTEALSLCQETRLRLPQDGRLLTSALRAWLLAWKKFASAVYPAIMSNNSGFWMSVRRLPKNLPWVVTTRHIQAFISVEKAARSSWLTLP